MSAMNTIQIIAADHPVKSVVVLKSSKAEIVRRFDVALQGGQNKLIISKLPSTIDTQSVRISGLNPSGTKNKTYLSDVVCSVSEDDDESNEIIHALEAKRNALWEEKKVFATQAEILVKYANSLTGEHASPNVMNGFLSAFAEHGKLNITSTAKLEAEIEKINKSIKEEKKKLSLRKGSAKMEITVVITADSDTRVDLKLSYIVNKTNWSPTYELHAVTGENEQPSRTVALHYRACITQSTGEDWTDASLILSTVESDTIIKHIPKLEPVKIAVAYNNGARGGIFQNAQILPNALPKPRVFIQQQQFTAFGANQQQPQGGLFGVTQPQSLAAFGTTQPQAQSFAAFGATQQQPQQGGLFGATQQLPLPPPAPGVAPATTSLFGSASRGLDHTSSESGVIPLSDNESEDEGGEETPVKLVTQTPMALTYTVRGKSSIPSDGKEHIVTIAVLSFETDVEYVSVPRIDPRVYLQCQVKNNSEYRLLPGPVSIILDDGYVSKTTISDVNRNDTFSFTLGDDPSVHISYSRISKTIKEGTGTFADIVNITTYTASISVENKHGFPIEKLILRDAVPVSDDRRVRILLRKPKELIEAKEGVSVKVSRENAEEEAEEGGLRVRWTQEKDGLYEYRWRVDADKKIKLETVFELKASNDLTCTFEGHAWKFGKRA